MCVNRSFYSESRLQNVEKGEEVMNCRTLSELVYEKLFTRSSKEKKSHFSLHVCVRRVYECVCMCVCAVNDNFTVLMSHGDVFAVSWVCSLVAKNEFKSN